MQTTSLRVTAEQALADAHQASSGRSASTVYGGSSHALRQTVIALVAGQPLHEHESPGESTLQVLIGRVRLTDGGDPCEASAGDVVALPDSRHALEALEDSVVLLTVAKAGILAAT